MRVVNKTRMYLSNNQKQVLRDDLFHYTCQNFWSYLVTKQMSLIFIQRIEETLKNKIMKFLTKFIILNVEQLIEIKYFVIKLFNYEDV